MSLEQSSIPDSSEIAVELRNDLDRIRSGKELTELESIGLIQALRDGISTIQSQVQNERQQALQAQVESRRRFYEQRIQRLEASEKEHRQEITAPSEGKFVVAGRVLDAGTREALPGIRVQGMERDPDQEDDDLLGEVRTDRGGFYRLEYTEESFHAPQDEEPETYIRVLDEDGNALFTSDQSYRHKAGKVEVINAAIEGSKVPESLELGTQLRENLAAELNDLRRREQYMENRHKLLEDPLSMLPSQDGGNGPTTEE